MAKLSRRELLAGTAGAVTIGAPDAAGTAHHGGEDWPDVAAVARQRGFTVPSS